MNKEEQLNQLDKQIIELKNKRYRLKEELIKEQYIKCQKNKERCFKTTLYGYGDGLHTTYYKIIATQEIEYQMRGGSYFNNNEYQCLVFNYPYNNKINTFILDDINIFYKLNNKEIEEISLEEFNSMLIRVNNEWIKTIVGNEYE